YGLRCLAEVILLSIIISSVRFWVPYAFGKCVDDKEFRNSMQGAQVVMELPDVHRFMCEEGQVNDLGLIFWIPQQNMIRWLLHASQVDSISTWQCFVALIFLFGFTSVVCGIAIVGGLFIPSIASGAC